MREKFKPYKKYFITCIPLYIFTLIMCGITIYCFALYAELLTNDKTVAMDKVVYAEVTDIVNNRVHVTEPLSNHWTVLYEYDDGKYVYRGGITVAGKDNAEAYRINKVAIYIDGKGHSIAVIEYKGDEKTPKALIAAIVCTVIDCVLVGLAVRSFLKQRRKVRNQPITDSLESDNQ